MMEMDDKMSEIWVNDKKQVVDDGWGRENNSLKDTEKETSYIVQMAQWQPFRTCKRFLKDR